MNTSYLWRVALLACFLALGGLGDELPTVDLCRRNITDADLGEELDRLATNKTMLDLCENQLKSFDRDLFRRFVRLEELVFDGNPDLVFPADGSPFLEIKTLTKLQCIKCGVDRIFNRSLQDLPKIERINLTNNRITEIERLAFRGNSELQLIDLQHNLLERLPNALIEGLRKLEHLDLSFNQKLNADGDQPFLISSNLRVLKCEGCGFTEIYEQTFAKLPNLQELDLRGNFIMQVRSDAINLLRNLEKLWLQNNKLVSVYDKLLDNNELQLCLDNNTDQLLCELQKIESWQKFHCQNETTTEVNCIQFTEPTTVQTEISPSSQNENSTIAPKTITTVITTTTEVTTSTTHKPPSEPMGISDWYISSYLTIIFLALVGVMVILVGFWLKMKKYDSDPELDSLAGTILNPSTIYKPLY